MKVELQNLTKIFPSRNKKDNSEVIAVNNFTFELTQKKAGSNFWLYGIKIYYTNENNTTLTHENISFHFSKPPKVS